jgi:arylsulfatase A-like enzyme
MEISKPITISIGLAITSAINAAPPSPNILFITVDDLKPDIGCYGDKLAITPNINKLASRGTVFLNNQCQQAVCAPSRVSMFTGLRPDTTKVWDLKTNMRDVCPDALTIPEYFSKKGYQTTGLGKLMHGAKDGDCQSWTIPCIKDADLKYKTPYGYPANGHYLSELSRKSYDKIKKQKLNWREKKDYMRSQGAAPAFECLDVPDAAYTDGAIADKGIKMLEKFAKSAKPFFLALGFHKPHLPFVAPKKYWDLYNPKDFTIAKFQKHAKGSPNFAYHTWGELRKYCGIPSKGPLPENRQKNLIHAYYACISYIDAQIGKVIEKLDKLGLAENTIIIIWGDHGWHLGDHGLWCKHSNFEQATHAPLIIVAPGYKGGQKTESPTEFIDVFPTLCQLTGNKAPEHLQGTSLIPILKSPKEMIKKFAVSQFPRGNKMGYSLRTRRYRYTIWLPWNKKQGITSYTPIAEELYDYEKDPMETINKAGNIEYKTEVRKLSEMMQNFLHKTHQR